LTLFGFGIEHFIFRAAGAAAFLATDFFLLLLFLAFDAEDFSFELIAKVAPGKIAVGALQAGLFTLYFQPGGPVDQMNAGGGFIYFLPTRAGGTDKPLGQIGLTDFQLVHPFLKLFPFPLRNHEGMESWRGIEAQRKAHQIFKFRLAMIF
jgi:hypothetical protein